MAYRLKKQFRFEASHQLMKHDGKCRRLHGHSWTMEVEVGGSVLQIDGAKDGMLTDFGDISAAVKPLVEQYLDHYHLNETLETESPTSEYVATWVFDKLRPLVPGLVAVTIHETCTSECRYEPVA